MSFLPKILAPAGSDGTSGKLELTLKLGGDQIFFCGEQQPSRVPQMVCMALEDFFDPEACANFREFKEDKCAPSVKTRKINIE